jgi:hypothetical protein
MLGYEAHFGGRRGRAALDLLPDRLYQRDTGHKDSFLVVLKINFLPGFTEEPAFGN